MRKSTEKVGFSKDIHTIFYCFSGVGEMMIDTESPLKYMDGKASKASELIRIDVRLSGVLEGGQKHCRS